MCWRSLGSILADVTETALMKAMGAAGQSGTAVANPLNALPPPRSREGNFRPRLELKGPGAVRHPAKFADATAREDAQAPESDGQPEGSGAGWPVVTGHCRFRRHGILALAGMSFRAAMPPARSPRAAALMLMLVVHLRALPFGDARRLSQMLVEVGFEVVFVGDEGAEAPNGIAGLATVRPLSRRDNTTEVDAKTAIWRKSSVAYEVALADLKQPYRSEARRACFLPRKHGVSHANDLRALHGPTWNAAHRPASNASRTSRTRTQTTTAVNAAIATSPRAMGRENGIMADPE